MIIGIIAVLKAADIALVILSSRPRKPEEKTGYKKWRMWGSDG